MKAATQTFKYHPMLMTGQNIIAILENRKHQTRRIVAFDKMHPDFGEPHPEQAWVDSSYMKPEFGGVPCLKVPYGDEKCAMGPTVQRYFPRWEVGDRLWIKETFWHWGRWQRNGLTKSGKPAWRFVAMENSAIVGRPLRYCVSDPLGSPLAFPKKRTDVGWHKRPAIFMEQRLSRITNEITKIRCEPLQSILPQDIIAEGMDHMGKDKHIGDLAWYRNLWESIHGAGSWNSLQWCWVLDFKRI